jgi:calcineurin-like phosphoesterase family protein
MNTFFTADTHLGHSAIIRFCSRPFSNVEEMNEIIIKNWNLKVKPKDRVYIIGDFAFGSREKILNYTRRLSGHKILIVGNHDNIGQPSSYGFAEKYQLLTAKINGTYITMCHYAMRIWERSHYDSWHLFGHSHGTLEAMGKSWDVGVDNNGFAPLEFEEVKKIMDLQPHNLNWLEKLKGFDPKEYESYRQTEMS